MSSRDDAASRRSAPAPERAASPAREAEAPAREAATPAQVLRRGLLSPRSLTSGDVLRLQRALGNRAVGRLLAPSVRPAPAGALQRNITTTAAEWFSEPAAITAPVGAAAQANAEKQVNKYLAQHLFATGGRTFTQELNRVKPFISAEEGAALDHALSSIRLNNANGWQRATTIVRIDALGTLINQAADKITLAGGEAAHANFRATYGGTVADLNEALALAGDAATLQGHLDAAHQELFVGREDHRKNVNTLLPLVRKALRDRANGPSVRGWGHRAGGAVVIFWVDGVAGYWDFAEVHVHINRPGDGRTEATAADAAGEYVANRSVPGERYVRAVNVRVPYSGVVQGDDVDLNDPVAALCLGHVGYDPTRWQENQGNLAQF